MEIIFACVFTLHTVITCSFFIWSTVYWNLTFFVLGLYSANDFKLAWSHDFGWNWYQVAFGIDLAGVKKYSQCSVALLWYLTLNKLNVFRGPLNSTKAKVFQVFYHVFKFVTPWWLNAFIDWHGPNRENFETLRRPFSFLLTLDFLIIWPTTSINLNLKIWNEIAWVEDVIVKNCCLFF